MSVITENIKKTTEQLRSIYFENQALIQKTNSDSVNSHREFAMNNVETIGIPDKKFENYKYTDLNSLFSQAYPAYYEPNLVKVNMNEVFKCDVPELDADVITLSNGWYGNQKEKITQLPNGMIYGSFAEASFRFPQLFEKYYNKNPRIAEEGITNLNTAFAQDGLFIYVPDNVVVEKPIQIINMLIAQEDLFVQPRNLFIFGKNSEAKIIICDHTLSAYKFFTNSVTEIYAGENSRLDFNNLQNEHNASNRISSVFIDQAKTSSVLFNTLTIHGGLIRNNIYVTLDEACDHNLLGLYLTDKWQHIDNFTFIEHKKPNSNSRQLYKGVLDDTATGAFNGKILVNRDAQKTNAFQANNNILLTNEAKINTKPQLEIYADDVKCSHGATVGQLDENALFYMQARGIGQKEARLLLMYGFVYEIIKEIKVEPLRERYEDLVNKRLRGELSRCNNCPMHCS